MLRRWALAYRNLKRNFRRNLATGIAIGLGFSGLLFVGGYANRVVNYLRVYTVYASRVGHVLIYKKGGFERHVAKPKKYSFTPEEQAKIEAIFKGESNVELFARQLVGVGLVGNGCNSFPFMASAVDLTVDEKVRRHREVKEWTPRLAGYLKGRPPGDFDPSIGAVAVSSGLAKLIGKPHVSDEVSDAVKKAPIILPDCSSEHARDQIASDASLQLLAGTWSGSLSAIEAESVAHFMTGFSETERSALQAPLETLQRLYDTDRVTYYSVWLRSAINVGGDLNRISNKLEQAGIEADVYPWDDDRMSPYYTGTMRFLTVMLGFISIVVSAVVTLSIFNTATITVLERSQEVGTLRSLGFSSRKVQALFVHESALLAMGSIFGGSVFGVIAMLGVNSANIWFYPPGVAGGLQLILSPSPWFAAAAAAGLVGLAMIATFFAVRRTARQNIATLLAAVQR